MLKLLLPDVKRLAQQLGDGQASLKQASQLGRLYGSDAFKLLACKQIQHICQHACLPFEADTFSGQAPIRMTECTNRWWKQIWLSRPGADTYECICICHTHIQIYIAQLTRYIYIYIYICMYACKYVTNECMYANLDQYVRYYMVHHPRFVSNTSLQFQRTGHILQIFVAGCHLTHWAAHDDRWGSPVFVLAHPFATPFSNATAVEWLQRAPWICRPAVLGYHGRKIWCRKATGYR